MNTKHGIFKKKGKISCNEGDMYMKLNHFILKKTENILGVYSNIRFFFKNNIYIEDEEIKQE